MLHGQFLQRFIIKLAGLQVNRIRNNLILPAGAVKRTAVGKMPAVGQRHAHNHIARNQERVIDGVIGGRAGERLDIDEYPIHRGIGIGE